MSSHGGGSTGSMETSSRSGGARAATRPRAPTAPKPMTPAQRKTLATQEIMKAVGAITPTEKEVAITAALEAVKEQLLLEPEFQGAFRQKYEEIQRLGMSSRSATKPKADLGPMPQPKPWFHLAAHNPLANLSPYEIAEAWEHRDFRSVLAHAGRDLVREMVDVVKVREPGAKLPNKNSMPAMMNWITLHVLGPGY